MKTKSHKWTEKQHQYLRDNITGTPLSKMTEMINKEYGIKLTDYQVKARLDKLNLKNGINAQFKKRDIPFTKGKKWDEYMSKESQKRSRKTTFKKGDVPANYKPIGFEYYDKRDKVTMIKVSDVGTWPERWKAKHRFVWENENGPIPKNH